MATSPAGHVAGNAVLTAAWQKVADLAPQGVELNNDTEVFVDQATYNDPDVVMLERVGGATRTERDGTYIVKLACAPANSEQLSSNVQAAAKPKEWAS